MIFELYKAWRKRRRLLSIAERARAQGDLATAQVATMASVYWDNQKG